jgi:hypothetical protein
MSERDRLVSNCSLVIPTVMGELDAILVSKSDDVVRHISTAKQLLSSLLEQTEKALIEANVPMPAMQVA